mmetsp:Transcript_23239/g.38511  ORF Transcript_23239/g.38511 Transcript_23239/m.38511 type:complete len:427 (-) Transcript_23239:721-2001(-)
MTFLIDLDGGKNLADKPQGCQGTNGTCYQQHGKAKEEHVSKVEQVGHEHLGSLQGTEPKHGVDKGVECRRPGREEGVPPPAMILGAELVINQQDSNFSASDAKNDKDNEGKAKDVVELIHPHGSHNEEELDVGGSKGDNTGDRHAHIWVKEGRRRWNGAGDGGSDGWVFNRFSLVSKVSSQKDQWDGDAAPHGCDDDNVQERSRCGRVQEEENDVEEKEGEEADSRVESSSKDSTQLPLTTTEGLVQSGRDVSSNDTAEHVEDQGGRHEGPTACWREETDSRERDDTESREEDLDTSSDENGVQHRKVVWWTEDISVDQLPASLVDIFILLFISESCDRVVSSNITLQVTDKDGYNEERKEKNDKDRVGDGVPVDLGRNKVVLTQVDIPARGPRGLRSLPGNIVGVHDHLVRLNNLVGTNHTALHV